MNNTAFCQYYFIRDFELWHNEGCISEQQRVVVIRINKVGGV